MHHCYWLQYLNAVIFVITVVIAFSGSKPNPLPYPYPYPNPAQKEPTQAPKPATTPAQPNPATTPAQPNPATTPAQPNPEPTQPATTPGTGPVNPCPPVLFDAVTRWRTELFSFTVSLVMINILQIRRCIHVNKSTILNVWMNKWMNNLFTTSQRQFHT